MKFFKQIKDSVYNPAYYQKIISGGLGVPLKYYFKLALLSGLVVAIHVSFLAVPKLEQVARSLSDKIISYYPDGLEIIIENGRVSTNADEPLLVPLPASSNLDFAAGSRPAAGVELTNLLVIDTSTGGVSEDRFRQYQTLVWLTDRSLVHYDDNGAIVIQPLGSLNLTINKGTISGLFGLLGYFSSRWVYLLFGVLAFVGVLLVFLINLLYLFLVAVLVWLVVRLKNVKLTYGQAYRLALPAATLPLALHLLLPWFGVTIPVPFSGTIILLLVALANVKP